MHIAKLLSLFCACAVIMSFISSRTAPAAPSGLSAHVVSGNQIILQWKDNARNESGYRLERSTDSVNWDLSILLPPNSSRYYSLRLSPLTTYYYRVRAENAGGHSPYITTKNTTFTNAAPDTWKEHWFEHNKLLKKVFDSSDVSIYFDDDVNPNTSWMFRDFAAVWSYVKQNYGDFSDPRLYMIFHGATYSGGHPAAVFDPTHDYRNVGDLGGNWDTRSAWNLGASVHEVGHIVEGSSRGVHNSPAWDIWKDSKWCEIFIYDVYKRLGWTTDAEMVFHDFMNKQDDFPRAGTQWFRNWFYPIYSRADSSAALSRFFVLLSQHFPQLNGEYTRGMNMGEFVHFWSGAARFNLRRQAEIAFGWTDEWEQQFRQARKDFPFTYPDTL